MKVFVVKFGKKICILILSSVQSLWQQWTDSCASVSLQRNGKCLCCCICILDITKPFYIVTKNALKILAKC